MSDISGVKIPAEDTVAEEIANSNTVESTVAGVS
jgi:hypothetical protein